MCAGKGCVGDNPANTRANSRVAGQGGAGARREPPESVAVNEKKRLAKQPSA